METVRIRDPGWKKSDLGQTSPDPQHCVFENVLLVPTKVPETTSVVHGKFLCTKM
jgi:hypothetical protein